MPDGFSTIDHHLVQPTVSRLAYVRDNVAYYVAVGRGDALCLIEFPLGQGKTPPVAENCGRRALLAKDGAIWLSGGVSGHPSYQLIAGVVPDIVTRVAANSGSAVLHSNVFTVYSSAHDPVIRLSSRRHAFAPIDIGPVEP